MNNNRYQKLNALDTSVFIGFDQLNSENIILKQLTLPDSKDTAVELLTQLRIASSLRHSNLVPILDYIVNDQEITLVSPIISDSRPVMDVLHSTDRDTKIEMLVIILGILAFLHENHLIHGNVSPDNILVSNGNLLVKDFGFRLNASVQDDLYAIGIMLYMLIVQDESLDFYALLNHENTPNLDAVNTGDDAYDDRLRMVLYWLFACKENNGYSNALVAIDALNSLREDASAPMAVIKQEYIPYPPLIGRDRVVKRFEKLLAQAGNNQGALWFLHGEHGSGKTRVLTTFKHQAQLAGYAVLTVRANQWQSTWIQIVKQLLVTLDMHLEQEHARILRHIAPEIEQILNLPEDTPPDDKELASDRVSAVIATLFESIDTPTLVLIDDIEYLNDYPLTLGYIHAIIAQLPLIFVCTTAVDDQIKALKNRYPIATFVNLKPLSADDTALLCQHYSKTQVHHLVERFIYNQSQGNPFYAVESISALINDAGRMEDVNHLELPKGTTSNHAADIAANYLDQIAQEDRDAVIYSAMLGNTINLSLLQKLMCNPGLDTNWLYTDLFKVEFGEWSFKNNVIRQGILDQLSDDERQSYNRYIAETLESTYVDKSNIASLLVYYWHMAGDLERELENIRVSIDRMMDESYDYLQAREMVERALSLLSKTKDDNDASRMEFLQLLGDICLEQQEISQGLLYYFEALSLSRIHDTQQQEISVLRRIANALIVQGEYREALTALERSFKICQRIDDTRNSAFVLYDLAVHYIRLNEYDEAYQRIQRCFRYFDILPEEDPELRDLFTRAIAVKGTIVNQKGDADQSIELFQSAIERLRKFNKRKELVEALTRYAQALISQVSFEFADTVYQEILQHYKELRDYSAYQRSLIDYARLKMMMGQLEDAENEIKKALTPKHYVDTPELMAQALMTAGMIAFSAKNYTRAIDYYKRAYELGESQDLTASAIESTARRGVAVFFDGQVKQAHSIITNATNAAAQIVDNPTLQLTVLIQLAYVLIETGKAESAAKTVGHIKAHQAHNALHEFEIRHYLMPALEEHMSDDDLQTFLNNPNSMDSLSQILLDMAAGVG